MHARSNVYSQAHSSAKSGANGDERDTQSTAHKPCEGTDVPVIMLQLACVRSLPSAAPRCIHGAPTAQVTASTCDHRRTPAACEPLSGQLRPSTAPASHHRGEGRGRHSSTAESMASSAVVSVPPKRRCNLDAAGILLHPAISLTRQAARGACGLSDRGCSRSVRGA